MSTPILDSLGDLKISPGETVRVTIGGRTLLVYEPITSDDGPPYESAPPFPDPPGLVILQQVRIGPPEVPEPFRFDDSDLAPGFYEGGDDLLIDDAGRAVGPG